MTPQEKREHDAQEYQRLAFKLEAIRWRLEALARDISRLVATRAEPRTSEQRSLGAAPTVRGPGLVRTKPKRS